MLDTLLNKMTANFPALPKQRSLLAVSAGIDSVVMAHLFVAAGWSFGLAHVNFQLRGIASLGDEDFVRNLAEQWGTPFYTISFDTIKEAENAGISIQMMARRLRYDWFEKIRRLHRYDYLVTAHHLNDSIETSLLNQTRGTGIRGLLGIPIQQDTLIRPMLSITREELVAFAQENGIDYREDSSNSKDEYYRNRIRHQVTPVLQSINPSLVPTFQKNLHIWSQTAYLMEWACRQLWREYAREEPGRFRIDLRFVLDHPTAALTLLYEWLKAFNFHGNQLQEAIDSVGGNSGAVWYTSTHRLLVDREAFIVERIAPDTEQSECFFLTEPGALPLPDGYLSAHLQPGKPDLKAVNSNWEAYLDAEKVQFPLTVRHWQPGDSFCPLGMAGQHKKVQDFFTDEKISRFDKEKIWLVFSENGELVWIVGYRIDERCKISEETVSTLVLQFTGSYSLLTP